MDQVSPVVYGGWGTAFFIVFTLLFLAVLALAAYTFFKLFAERRADALRFQSSEPADTPGLRALRERYERGEIDLATYHRERTTLENRERS